MNKNSKKYLIVISILIVLYNILVWVIPFPKKDISTFIISYIASMIALIVQPIIYYIAVHEKETVKSKIYGWPILKVGYVYCIIQLLLTLIFYILGVFVKIPTWISIVLVIIIMAFALIGIIITDTYREEIEKMETNFSTNKQFILNLKIDAETYARKTTIEPFHTELIKFVELVKYSDPVSNESLVDIEEEICSKYNDIKYLIDNEKYEDAVNKLKEITLLMEERNIKCKLTK